jgi:hypothetical protein
MDIEKVLAGSADDAAALGVRDAEARRTCCRLAEQAEVGGGNARSFLAFAATWQFLALRAGLGDPGPLGQRKSDGSNMPLSNSVNGMIDDGRSEPQRQTFVGSETHDGCDYSGIWRARVLSRRAAAATLLMPVSTASRVLR